MNQTFRLEHINLLHLLWIIPILILVFYISVYRRKKALKKFGDINLLGQLMVGYSSAKPKLKFYFFLFAVVFLIFAIVNPQIGSKLREAERSGIDIMIALDISKSMNAEDIKPSRLKKAKQSISQLIDKLTGDRIGIIVFAGKAYTQLPITTDYSAAKMFLSTIDSDLAPKQGTSIGNAIELAMNSFDENDNSSKSIIIITDGEDHEEEALTFAKEANNRGITVHTIGMGLPEGAPIPVFKNNRKVGFKKDRSGNTVVSKLNEQLLVDIAKAGEGNYVRANNIKTGLKLIFDDINAMEKKKFESKMFSDYEDRFQYVLAVAIIFLIISILITNVKNGKKSRFNLFEKGGAL